MINGLNQMVQSMINGSGRPAGFLPWRANGFQAFALVEIRDFPSVENCLFGKGLFARPAVQKVLRRKCKFPQKKNSGFDHGVRLNSIGTPWGKSGRPDPAGRADPLIADGII